jgi:hypothetical protein
VNVEPALACKALIVLDDLVTDRRFTRMQGTAGEDDVELLSQAKCVEVCLKYLDGDSCARGELTCLLDATD